MDEARREEFLAQTKMTDSDSDYDSDSDGYGTPEEESASHERLRQRSRSRIDGSHNNMNSRDRLDNGNRQQHGSQQRRRGGHRHGRRQRQRNRRNQRNRQDESWYFPEEQREGNTQDLQQDLITENQAWVQSLLNTQPVANQPVVSPLTQGNNHTLRWTDNNNRVTVTQDQQVNVENIRPASRSSNMESDHEHTRERLSPEVERSREMHRPPSRQSQRVPISSNPDVNFNLAQQLENRNRALQQLTQAASQELENRNRALQQLTQAASQIQVAAAAAAANYAQFISTQNSITTAPQQNWDNNQSWDTWDNRYDTDEQDSWLNVSNSTENRRQARRENQSRRSSRARRAARRQRAARQTGQYQVVQRSSNDINRLAQQHSSHLGGLGQLVNNINPSQDNINSSDRTLIPQSGGSTSSVENNQVENQSVITSTTPTDENNPYQRFDVAFRRQDDRNEWRRRRSRRHVRQTRREAARRRRQRVRTDRSNIGRIEDNSNQNLRPSQLDIVQQSQLPIPIPPPLPAVNWVPPPRAGRMGNEWPNAPQTNDVGNIQLENQVNSNRDESEFYDSELENVLPRAGLNDDDINDYYQDYEEQIEAILRSYIDPSESTSTVGEFLRRISERGRVIISRVRTRITKQYFRRGDFQIALSDFRNLNPEHARQVPGVGFTGTVNNMYRLTVKQNSSFGKPTFEIRPMNKRVRKKKVHVCYKIRYFTHRDRNPPRPPPRNRGMSTAAVTEV